MKRQNQKTRASGLKNLVEIYNENKTKLTKIHFFFFFRLQNVSKTLD